MKRNQLMSATTKILQKMLTIVEFIVFLTFSLKSLIEILKIKLLRPTGHVVLLPASFAEDDKPRPGEDVTSTCQHPKFRSENENVRESKWPTWQVTEIKTRTPR